MGAATLGWLLAAITVLLLVEPRSIDFPPELAHLALFACGSATSTAWLFGRWRLTKLVSLVAVLGVFIAVVTELAQAWFVSERRGQLSDFWADVAGVGLGLIAAIACVALLGERGRHLAAVSTWIALVTLLGSVVVSDPLGKPAIDCGDHNPDSADTLAEPAWSWTADDDVGRGEPSLAPEMICLVGQEESFTVVAIAASNDLEQTGPTRIVTSSVGYQSADINFHLGQEGTALSVRIRSGNHGIDKTLVSDVFTDTEPHTIAVRFDHGDVTVVVDGEAATHFNIDDSLARWEVEYPIIVGDEFGGDRTFLGHVEVVEIHARALNDDELASWSR
ncbi:MAG: LamG domain-containing protein [Actinomycetia bacterium]|nr:LamG domain-containing protein [Actinomycetes bacterium]